MISVKFKVKSRKVLAGSSFNQLTGDKGDWSQDLRNVTKLVSEGKVCRRPMRSAKVLK